MNRRAAAITLTAAACVAGPSSSARADEVLSLQAQAVAGGWTLPAPGQRAAMCIVDSGLDPAQLDVPTGIRTATAPGITGTGPALDSTGQPVMHGTWMVQNAVAPADGQGMIGTSPGVAVVFIRAMRDGTGRFNGEDYSAGMLQCTREAQAAGWRLASIALALGTDAPTDLEQASVATRVAGTSAVPVAAVGNRPGVPQFPASADGVVGITAVSAVDGTSCAGSADADPEAAGLVGPGCFVTMPVNGQARPVKSSGTSGASVVVAAAIAQICDLQPTLTPRQCLGVLQNTARAVPGGKLPDLRAAAASLGLTAPAVTAPLATLIEPGTTTPADPSGPEVLTPPAIAPRWYGANLRPKLARAKGGKVTVTSPDKNHAAVMWTNMRYAKVGKFRKVTGRPKGTKVRVRLTQKANGQLYKREWTLRVPRGR